MKSWAVSSLQGYISIRALASQVRERMQLRTKQEKTWLVFSWMKGQMWLLASVQLRWEEGGPAAIQTNVLQNPFPWIQEPVKVLYLFNFFPRCESETHDHLAHLRFARLGLVEQRQFCSAMTRTVTAWGNKLVLHQSHK